MALIHDVIDSDVRFAIDPVTRTISNQGSNKLVLTRGDHNSERFTFEIPRYVEGHDMSLCNVVRIHFINTDSKTREEMADVYEPDDASLLSTDDQVFTFSWLIARSATTFAGPLAFAIEFQCVVDGVVVYSWRTVANSTITIADGIDNTDPAEVETNETPVDMYSTIRAATVAATIHDIIDSDVRFTIDPITRSILNDASGKLILVRGDHNSERFTFAIPRYVEGHDMSKCNVVRIHYINTESKTRATREDIYEPNDLRVDEENSEVAYFSWLLSNNATFYTGSLAFSIEFQCVINDVVEYAWHTGINSTISVADGIDNAETVGENISDILASWWHRLYSDSTLPIEIHTMESFEALGSNTEPNTLYLLEDDPTIEELIKLQDPLKVLDSIVKDLSTINAKLNDIVAHSDAIVAIQTNVSKLSVQVDDLTNAIASLSDRVDALEDGYVVNPDNPDNPDIPDTPDDPEHTHSYDKVVSVVAPSCDEHGYTVYKCSCGETENRNYISPLGHSYKDIVTPPTCTEQGYTTHKCSACGNSYKDTPVAATGHSWTYYQDPSSGETGWSRRCTVCNVVETNVEYGCMSGGDHSWIANSTINATCTTPGYQKYYCPTCGEVKQEAISAPLSPTREHDWSSAIYDVVGCFEPTCIEAGHAAYVCNRCNEEKEADVPALQHSFTDVIIPPTCTEQGYTLRKCTRDGCDYSFIVNDSYVAANGHTWDKDPIDSGTGYVYPCVNCSATKNVTVDNCGHTDEVIDYVAPTCTEQGYTIHKCSLCNREEEVFEKALGHKYVGVVTEPTCENQGYTTYTCSRCGDVYVDNYVDAGAHRWSGWTTDIAPTCVEDGLKTRTCSACGKVDASIIEADGHDMAYVPGKAPTCTSSGWSGYNECSKCGHIDNKVWYDPLGHDLVITPEVPATCTEYGYTELETCSRCDYHYGGDIIEPNGHSFPDGWEEYKAPTCSESGIQRRYCANCNYYEADPIPALGHDWEYYPDPTVSSGTSRQCRVCELIEKDV